MGRGGTVVKQIIASFPTQRAPHVAELARLLLPFSVAAPGGAASLAAVARFTSGGFGRTRPRGAARGLGGSLASAVRLLFAIASGLTVERPIDFRARRPWVG